MQMCHSRLPLDCVLSVLQPAKVVFRLGTLGLRGHHAFECSADCMRACPQAPHLSCMARL